MRQIQAHGRCPGRRMMPMSTTRRGGGAVFGWGRLGLLVAMVSALWVCSAATLASAEVAPLPTSKCLEAFELRCYVPAQLAKAYNLARLQWAGINGRGETIAIVIPFGSPTIRNDLHQFDQTFGVSNSFGVPVDPAIANDPQLRIIQPAGPVPPFSTTAFNGGMLAAASETTLDVEWAHVMAPGANILL